VQQRGWARREKCCDPRTAKVKVYMSEWLARLQGHQFDLEDLANHFTSADRNVKRDEDGHYYLRSSDFGQMTDPSAVRERALEILGHMNGPMKLHSGGSYRPVEFDMVSQIDGSGKRRHHIMLSATFEGRSRVTATPTDIRADGTEGASQLLDDVEALATLADQNEKVADALRFYNRGDWVNLYKAWEVVCDAAGGLHEVVRNGWAGEPDRGRFTSTAQSRAELGDEARHASERYKAPKDPLSLNEAQVFVRSVILAWVSTV
jgi:hypothetical protein